MTTKEITAEITRLLNQCNARQLALVLRIVQDILK